MSALGDAASPRAAARGPARRFADSSTVVQSWYPALRSRAVPVGGVARSAPCGQPIVLWRGLDGRVNAADARCPHLGAHLGHGSVTGNDLVCALHRFRFRDDGALVEAPALTVRPNCRLRTYPTTERWGFVWVWNGPQPLHALPGPAETKQLRTLVLPSQRFRCHHHLIAVNACDTLHLGPLHDLELAVPPEVSFPDAYHGEMRLVGRFTSSWKRKLTGNDAADFDARFVIAGGNICWVSVAAPVPFQVLFAGRPDAGGGARTQSFVFFPPGSLRRAVSVLSLLVLLLERDHEMLDDLAFRRGFTSGDRVLEAFVRHIDAMPVA